MVTAIHQKIDQLAKETTFLGLLCNIAVTKPSVPLTTRKTRKTAPELTLMV